MNQLPKKGTTTTLPPPQKVDCYQPSQEFEKKTIKIHLSENWQINSLLNYFRILQHDTIHDVSIFDVHIYIYIYIYNQMIDFRHVF